jgi:hypothetical protein
MNIVKIILIVAICVLIGLVLSVALGYAGVSPFDKFYVTAHEWVSGVNVPSAISNPVTIVTAAGSAVAVGAPILSKLNSVKKQAETTANQAQTQISNLSTTIDSKEAELSGATANLESAQAKLKDQETIIANLKGQVDTLNPQVTKMQNTISTLQSATAAQVIGALPGGTTITNPNGSTTTIVNKEVVK